MTLTSSLSKTTTSATITTSASLSTYSILSNAQHKLAERFNQDFASQLDDIHIPLQGDHNAFATPNAAGEYVLPSVLLELYHSLIPKATNPLHHLLLLGEPGAGKTHVCLHLCRMLWHMVDYPANVDFPTPFFIPLRQYADHLHQGLLEHVLEDYGLNQDEQQAILHHPLLLVFDGIDEVDIQYNRYQTLDWGSHADNLRLIITCRSNTLADDVINKLFPVNQANEKPSTPHKTIYLQPFTEKHMQAYVAAYVKRDHALTIADIGTRLDRLEAQQVANCLLAEDYLAWLQQYLPYLNTLITTPFFFKAIMHAFPRIKSIPPWSVTKTTILHEFVMSCLTISAKQIHDKGLLLSLSSEKLISHLYADVKNLASHLLDDSGELDTLCMTEGNSLRLRLSKSTQDIESYHGYHHSDGTSNQPCWFSNQDNANNYKINALYLNVICSSGLLQQVGNQFYFSHRLITEYLIAQGLIDGLLGKNDADCVQLLLSEDDAHNPSQTLNRLLFTDKVDILVTLADNVRDNETLITRFIAILMASKHLPNLHIAAANAITILVFAGVDLSGYDLSHVKIQQANLTAGRFIGTSFHQADLQDVFLHQADLTAANMSEANMCGVDFGEYPSLTSPAIATSVAVYQPEPSALHVLVGCRNEYVYRFDTTSGKQLMDYRHANDTQVLAVSVHNVSHLLVSATSDYMIRLWSLEANTLLRVLSAHTEPVTGVDVSVQGQWIASCGRDFKVCIWQGRGKMPFLTLEKHTDSVNHVVISPDNQWLASASSDRTIQLWSLPEGKLLQTLCAHTAPIYSLTINTTSKWLASGSADKTIRLWCAMTGTLQRTLRGHNATITKVVMYSNDKRLASSSLDHSVRIWCAISGKPLHVLSGHTDSVNDIAVGITGSLVSVSNDCTVRLWDLKAKEHLSTVQVNMPVISDIAIDVEHKRAISVGDDNVLYCWCIDTGMLLHTLPGHTKSVNSIVISADRKWIVSGSDDQTVGLWCAASGTLQHRFVGHKGRVSQVAISADNRWIASSSHDGTVYLWDRHDCTLHNTLQPPFDSNNLVTASRRFFPSVNSVAISGDGKWLISGSADGAVMVWSFEKDNWVADLLGHSNQVTSVAISTDSAWFASSSTDKTICLWDRESGMLLHTLTGHTDSVNSIAISADDRWLVSGSTDGTVRFWRQQDGVCLAVLTMNFEVNTVAISDAGIIVVGRKAVRLSLQIDAQWQIKAYQYPQAKWITRNKTALNLYGFDEPQLKLEGIHIEDTRHLSSQNRLLCEQNSKASALSAVKGLFPYQHTSSHLFKPAITPSQPPSSQLVLIDETNSRQMPSYAVSEDIWVISVVKQSNNHTSADNNHYSLSTPNQNVNINDPTSAFLIIEGINKYQQFIKQAQLINAKSKHAFVTLNTLDNLAELHESTVPHQACQFVMSARQGEALLKQIEAEQENRMVHGQFDHSHSLSSLLTSIGSTNWTSISQSDTGLSWCGKQIENVAKTADGKPHYNLPEQWYNIAITPLHQDNPSVDLSLSSQ